MAFQTPQHAPRRDRPGHRRWCTRRRRCRPGRRQDRNDRRVSRRLVRRLLIIGRGGRLGGIRSAAADWRRCLCGPSSAPHLGRFHETGRLPFVPRASLAFHRRSRASRSAVSRTYGPSKAALFIPSISKRATTDLPSSALCTRPRSNRSSLARRTGCFGASATPSWAFSGGKHASQSRPNGLSMVVSQHAHPADKKTMRASPKVLVIDDHEPTRDGLRAPARAAAGYTVSTASDGSDGLRAVQRRQPRSRSPRRENARNLGSRRLCGAEGAPGHLPDAGRS